MLYFKEKFSEPSTKKTIAVIIAWASVKFGIPELADYVEDFDKLAVIALGGVGFFVKEAKPLTEVK